MMKGAHLPDQDEPEVDAVHRRVVNVEDHAELEPAHAELEAAQEVEEALGRQSLPAQWPRERPQAGGQDSRERCNESYWVAMVTVTAVYQELLLRPRDTRPSEHEASGRQCDHDHSPLPFSTANDLLIVIWN